MKTLGIYVPSYKRPHEIMTDKLLNDCTYVVRKSEEEAYRKSGVRKIWAIEDELINSMSKVREYILENSPEDVVMQIDDDIKQFMHRLDDNVEIKDKDIIDDEFTRISQLLVDLNIGYAGLTVTSKPWNYTAEFSFKGLIGGVYWFNKESFKAKNDPKADVKEDVDKVLQELLHNRIILIPRYIAMVALVDTNEGGDNGNKNGQSIKDCNTYMKMKWGKYYHFDEKKNTPTIKVVR